MAGDLVAADVLELRLGCGIDADRGFALGLINRAARSKPAARDRPFEIEHSPGAHLDARRGA